MSQQPIRISELELSRLDYRPPLPSIFNQIEAVKTRAVFQGSEANFLFQDSFPHIFQHPQLEFESGFSSASTALRVGVLFSGGQAPGGHNVITGLFDALKRLNANNVLMGFLDGPGGLLAGKNCELIADKLSHYRNMGGFDLLGSDRTKLDAVAQEQALKRIQELKLDALVVIGGDDSNTNAAFLAEYFAAKNVSTAIIGIPKTIDGDLKSDLIEISFGFDSATKTYSQLIGNLARDAISAKKYYYFVKLMGRTASHIALECALQTHPNLTLIGEEIAEKKQNLSDVINAVCDLICERSKQSKDYGVILVPEGLLEFIPDCRQLIYELGHLEGKGLEDCLSTQSEACFRQFPDELRHQLLLDRDPHGNLQVSKLETERLLMALVDRELKKRKSQGTYHGKFSPQPLFYGYEGRCCLPSNFDANYCYALGYTAAVLAKEGKSGYMAALRGLTNPVDEWRPLGVPLLSLMTYEERKNKRQAVIGKALVDLTEAPFQFFADQRQRWALEDAYCYPGPPQYFGPRELTNAITLTLSLEGVKKKDWTKKRSI